MLKALLVPWIILASLASLGCVGTQETSQDSTYKAFVVAGEARASVINTLAVLNNAGYVSEDDYEAIDAAIELSGLALQFWYEALIKGAPTAEAEKQFYENFDSLKSIRDPAIRKSKQREPEA